MVIPSYITAISFILRNDIIITKEKIIYITLNITIKYSIQQYQALTNQELLRKDIEYMHESEKGYRHIFVVIKEFPSFFAARDAQINI